MNRRWSPEAKTGLLVLGCAVLLLGFLWKVGNFQLFERGYMIKSHFGFTGGLKKHAPVHLSGVEVGQVKDIRILDGEKTFVELLLWIRQGVRLRTNSIAYVTTLGLMGEKYVEIQAGTSEAPYAQEGDVLPSEDPVRFEEIVDIGTQVAEDVGRMAKQIDQMARHVDEAVVENKPRLKVVFENLEETSANFKDFSQDIKYHPWKVLIRGREKTQEEIEKIEKEKQKKIKAQAS